LLCKKTIVKGINIITVRYIMNLLYILFTLVMDSKIPISNSNIPNGPNALEIKLMEIPFLIPVSNGMDERFPLVEEDNEMDKILLHQYYLEQIGLLESYVQTLEEVIKDPIVREVLPLYEISPGRMKVGGLMDDWERNI
jgi:hypothetical protein